MKSSIHCRCRGYTLESCFGLRSQSSDKTLLLEEEEEEERCAATFNRSSGARTNPWGAQLTHVNCKGEQVWSSGHALERIAFHQATPHMESMLAALTWKLNKSPGKQTPVPLNPLQLVLQAPSSTRLQASVRPVRTIDMGPYSILLCRRDPIALQCTDTAVSLLSIFVTDPLHGIFNI